MFAVTRMYRFNPDHSAEIARRIQEGFIPLLRQTPGFVAYYWMDVASGVGVSASLFEDQSGSDESVRLAAEFVEEFLADFLGPAKIMKGKVLAHS